MNINELGELLIKKNVSKEMYSLDGGLPSEAYCIEKIGSKWHLYYSERGEKETISYFHDEEDVINAFLEEIGKYI